ncbi:hypothetical protein EVAR_60848_1 [Eumeta japonica]|uniref:Uncharacterized protein n=1 Tax=Eumeta variegata TaxID=151549 RepID=A0A4C1Y8U6_EUMVA|nr:hypothetical protein EVAR_60848_1 [Eumeta japonica]
MPVLFGRVMPAQQPIVPSARSPSNPAHPPTRAEGRGAPQPPHPPGPFAKVKLHANTAPQRSATKKFLGIPATHTKESRAALEKRHDGISERQTVCGHSRRRGAPIDVLRQNYVTGRDRRPRHLSHRTSGADCDTADLTLIVRTRHRVYLAQRIREVAPFHRP